MKGGDPLKPRVSDDGCAGVNTSLASTFMGISFRILIRNNEIYFSVAFLNLFIRKGGKK